MKLVAVALLVVGMSCVLIGCGGGGNGPAPAPLSLAGDWHFEAAPPQSGAGFGYIWMIEAQFDSTNQLTNAFAFTYHIDDGSYSAGIPCDPWPQTSFSSSLNGSAMTMTIGHYKFTGTVDGSGGINGSFTTSCPGGAGATFDGTQANGPSIQGTYSGTINANAFGPFALSGPCPSITISSGSLTSSATSSLKEGLFLTPTNFNVSFSGQYSCSSNPTKVQNFMMQGQAIGVNAALLSGTFGTTVLYAPSSPAAINFYNPTNGQ